MPDILVLGEQGCLFAEVKTGSGQTTAGQDLWAWTASNAGIQYVTWRESHWRNGTVEITLKGLR